VEGAGLAKAGEIGVRVGPVLRASRLSFWQRAVELSLPAALGIALWLLFTLK
jgi:hypothetical protein